ncbi:hypothetical protein BH10CHL1_BH10CHL1_00630 [soil metagenome]
MEELAELRSYIEQGKYPEALVLLGEMEEMSHEDKINKIGSFVVILLLHLIKNRPKNARHVHGKPPSPMPWMRSLLRINGGKRAGTI